MNLENCCSYTRKTFEDVYFFVVMQQDNSIILHLIWVMDISGFEGDVFAELP